ncbi:hypothetical protein OCL06_14910 [Alteromonas sp. ASW11-19]|uniref:PEP-CTERM sorting domain-containing protein n=1 Tax=Alteromonas salexigens TaxID=2982530 RepID=A0ABT2VS53_9ALTE|nr:hypothetical protein [Alteromonas salexigens]MCU7555879.1 hypothetical protein [Alteromonas salexigens]
MSYIQTSKKLAFVLTLTFTAFLYSFSSQAAIVASYDAEVDVSVSADFDIDDFESIFFDSFTFFGGSGVASASGDLSASAPLPAGSTGLIGANASGNINGISGFADSGYLTNGYLSVTNSTQSTLSGTITIVIDMLLSAFASTPGDFSLAFGSVYIERGDGTVIFDDFTEIFGDNPETTFSSNTPVTLAVSLAPSEQLELFFEVDADGLAVVSAPSTVAVFGLMLIGLVRLMRR